MNEKSELHICLILSTIFSFDMPARPAIIEIYLNNLPKYGHKIIWITNISNSDNKIESFNYNEIKIIGIPVKIRNATLLKDFDSGLRYVKKFFLINKILKNERCDILQVRNSLIDGIIALFFKKIYNIKVVFQYSFPVRFDENSCKSWILKRQLKYVLDNSDLIFPISKWMKNDLINKGVPESKIFALPMGINPIMFSAQIQDTEFREKFGSGISTIILYQGSLARERRVEVILRAIGKVKCINPDFRLLIVGYGDGKKDLENLCIELGIENEVIFTGAVPYAQMPRFISIADICLSPVPPNPIFSVSSPTKMFEYMVMKKPVVANKEIPEQFEVINISKCGLLVDFSSDAFMEGIIYLMSNPSKSREMGLNGYTWVIKNRSYEKLAHSVEKRYFELLETNK